MALQQIAFVDGVGDPFPTITATFGTVSASGWPNADTGQPWTVSSTSDCTSSGGSGLMSHNSVAVQRSARLTTPGSDQVGYAEVTVPVVPTGASITCRVACRMNDGFVDYYFAQLEILTSGAAQVRIRKIVGGVGPTDTSATVGAGTHSAGDTWAIELMVVGPHQLARAWKKSGTKPSGWQVTSSDTDVRDAAYTNAALLSRLESGNTNTLPVVIAWDNVSFSSVVQTRLDLHDQTQFVTTADTDWGMPAYDEAVVHTLMADDPTVPAAAYSGRVLTLVLDMPESSADTVAGRFQSLMRELQRPTNIIRYVGPGVTQPVFFRTFRASPSDVRWDSLHQVTIPIRAKSAAIGKRVDLAPVTVTNDPAAGSNGMFWDITGVQGDMETPALLRITAAAPLTGGQLSSLLSTRRRGTPSQMPMVLQCEAMTLGTDASLPGNDPLMSGSGNNYVRVTPGSTTMQNRVTLANWPASPVPDARGTYRVFLRCRLGTGTDVWSIRFTYGSPGVNGNIVNDAVSITNSNLRWIDLGDFTSPIFGDPGEDGLSGSAITPVGLGVGVQAQRVSGTGTLDVDALMFVPADDRLATINWNSGLVAVQTPAYVMLDAVHDTIYPADGGGLVHSNNQGLGRAGAFPMLSPGATNRLVLLINATPRGVTNMPDSISHTATIAVSYWPAYLYVRPVGT